MLAALARPLMVQIARFTIWNLDALCADAEECGDLEAYDRHFRQACDWRGYLGELRRQPGLWAAIKGRF